MGLLSADIASKFDAICCKLELQLYLNEEVGDNSGALRHGTRKIFHKQMHMHISVHNS